MNNTTKALIVCVAIIAVWIAIQHAPAKPPHKAAIQPVAVSGG